MNSGTKFRLVRSGDRFDLAFRDARARSEDFQDPGAVVSRDWLQAALELVRSMVRQVAAAEPGPQG